MRGSTTSSHFPLFTAVGRQNDVPQFANNGFALFEVDKQHYSNIINEISCQCFDTVKQQIFQVYIIHMYTSLVETTPIFRHYLRSILIYSKSKRLIRYLKNCLQKNQKNGFSMFAGTFRFDQNLVQNLYFSLNMKIHS